MDSCNTIGFSKRREFICGIRDYWERKYWKTKQAGIRLALRYIKWCEKDSNYLKHAKDEFNVAFKTCWAPVESDFDDYGMQQYMCDQILDLLAVLGTQGDSGSSIGYKLSLFEKLAKFETIAPLTFADDEFNDAHSLDGSAQNKRNSAVFKEKNGEIRYINAISKRPTYYCGEDAVVTKNVKSYCMSGGGFVIYPDRTIYYISNIGIIKDTKTFNSQKFEIPAYEIEYPDGWWLTFIKKEDLNDSIEIYDFKEVPGQERLEEEFTFEDGIYRDAIMARINAIIDHMYPETSSHDISSK